MGRVSVLGGSCTSVRANGALRGIVRAPLTPEWPLHPPSHIVIFGATGDLALRKLIPALASLAAKNQPANGFHVVGMSRAVKTSEQYRADVRAAMPPELLEAWSKLEPRVTYCPGDVNLAPDVKRLSEHLDALPGGATSGRLPRSLKRVRTVASASASTMAAFTLTTTSRATAPGAHTPCHTEL